jgi:hypothetical protein
MKQQSFGPVIQCSDASHIDMRDMMTLGLSESEIAEMIRIDISDWYFVEEVLRYLFLTYGDKLVMARTAATTVTTVTTVTANNEKEAEEEAEDGGEKEKGECGAPCRINMRLSGLAKPLDSSDDGLDKQFRQLGTGTYRLNLDGVTMIISFQEEGITAIGSNCCPPTYYRRLRFYVNPSHSKVVTDMYATIQDQTSKRKSDDLVIRVCDKYGEWNKYSTIPARKLNTIYVPDDVIARIKTDMSAFLAAKPEYEMYGIPYKKTYLLTGVPGSGKTSLVKALCNEFGLNLNILAINADMDNSSVTQAFRFTKTENTALLIEDIDCLFDGRSSKGKENSQFTFSNLINLLDGVMYKVGLITFITTNHPEMMDKALLRQGRIDTVVEMNYPRKREVRSMMMDMLKTRISCEDTRSAEFDKFYALIEKRKITMAALVLFVFRHRENYAEHIDELLDGDDFIRRVTGSSADEKILYN